MSIIIVVLVVAAIAAYLHRDKLKELVSKFRADVSKPDSGTSVPNVGVSNSVQNPFIAWMSLGYTMPDIFRIRQQRGQPASLNLAEMAQAREAGYRVDPDPVPTGYVDPNPKDLSDFGRHDNDIVGTLVLTFTLTRPQNIQVASSALAGTYFHEVESSVSGPVNIDFGHRNVGNSSVRDTFQAPAGTYTYRISTDGSVRLASQIVGA